MPTKKYRHLSYAERVLIGHLRSEGKSARAIGRELCRAPSTVTRELKRNEQFKGTRYYYPYFAQKKANGRRKRSYRKPYLKSEANQRFVEEKILEGWTPEQVAGYMRRECMSRRVSHEAIYQWIYRKKRSLREHLPWGRKRRYPRGHSRKHKRPIIKGKVDIAERPEPINARREYGHWECDLAIGSNRGSALLVLVERKSRYTLVTKIADRTAETVSWAIRRQLQSFHPHLRKSITYDNGHENARHLWVNEKLFCESYFCKPYHSWEKGTVENTIGLLRRKYPKSTDFNSLSPAGLSEFAQSLNLRPRKVLNYACPTITLQTQCVALQS